MKKTCISLFLALLVTGLGAPTQAPTARPTSAQDLEQELARLDQQLTADQAKLDDLNNRVEKAQGDVDLLNHKLAADQVREGELDKEVKALARTQYERPALTVSSVLEASTLQQLISNLAQARLVSHRQQAVQLEARHLRRQDQQIRDQQAQKLVEVNAAKDQAANVVTQTLVLRNQLSDQVLANRVGLVLQQAQATQAGALIARQGPQGAPVAFEAPAGNHFAYGYCTWYVANRRNIQWMGNAIDWWPNARAYGYAEGALPAVGAVMVTRESPIGHVAYVESVGGDGSWTVSEMNYAGWNIVDNRTIHPGGVPLVGFIYGKG
ncbi:MAG: CHAP domain-containing protein [Candidatus Dormibacteraeota bacterium]|nr:CHAP domain-containing protein [Candidatus Dormibacteraeota bacterium]